MANLQEQYDSAFLGILQNEGQLVNFLDRIFSFLYRRTDFYVEMTSKTDKMGFPQGFAKKLVLQVFRKYEEMAMKQKETQKKMLEKAKAMETQDTPESSKDCRPAEKSRGPQTKSSFNIKGTATCTRSDSIERLHMESTPSSESKTSRSSCSVQATAPLHLPTTESGDNQGQISADSVQDMSVDSGISSSAGHAADSVPTTSSVVDKDLSSSSRQEDSTGAAKTTTSVGDDDDDNSELARQQKVFQDSPDSYNGAIREKYSWSQSITDVDVKIFVPPHITKGRDLKVDIQRKHLSAHYKAPSGDWEVIVDGQLMWDVNKEESMWSLEPGKSILVNLEKVQERWWEAVLTDEPKINVRKIDPSRPMSDLDDEAQAKIEEMMYNERQKKLGLPQSHEAKTHEMLRKAWDAEGSPFRGQPFDPSLVNVAPPNSSGFGGPS